jgi:hypothetical protein
MVEIDNIFNMTVDEVIKEFPPEMEHFVLPNEEFSAALGKFATALIDTVNAKKTRVRPVVVRMAWEDTDADARSILRTAYSDMEIFTTGLVMTGIIEYYLGSMDQLIQQTNMQLMAAKSQIDQLTQQPKIREKSRIITLH